jgi:hypothetical protein
VISWMGKVQEMNNRLRTRIGMKHQRFASCTSGDVKTRWRKRGTSPVSIIGILGCLSFCVLRDPCGALDIRRDSEEARTGRSERERPYRGVLQRGQQKVDVTMVVRHETRNRSAGLRCIDSKRERHQMTFRICKNESSPKSNAQWQRWDECAGKW